MDRVRTVQRIVQKRVEQIEKVIGQRNLVLLLVLMLMLGWQTSMARDVQSERVAHQQWVNIHSVLSWDWSAAAIV